MDKLKWNLIFSGAGKEIIYDNWLERYLPYIRGTQGPALDLGCGLGNATSFLLQNGIETTSCDFSDRAVSYIQKKFPKAATLLHDMREKFPFESGVFGVVVADLSIHYFSWAKTLEIIDEVSRILREEGIFLFRVNSVDDRNYGAGTGRELERHYYSWDGSSKRFFDKEDIDTLIAGKWQRLEVTENRMDRYGKEKQVWEVALRKS